VETLPFALKGLLDLPETSLRWSVLIVDNASTDGTLEYALDCSQTWPRGNMRVVHEGQLGLTHARNRALADAEHEIVAFIDDDSIVTRDWLSNVAETFIQHPKAALVGGPIHVKWVGVEPGWLHPDLLAYFSNLDHGSSDCRLHYPQSPYGANYSVRRSVAQTVGGFRRDLGYTGKALVSGEDIELTMRIEAAGWEIWYCAGALVDHLIQGQRVTEEWLMRRAYGGGLTDVIVRRHRYRPWQQAKLMLDDLRWLRYAAADRTAMRDDPDRVRREARYWNARGRCRGWISRTSSSTCKGDVRADRQVGNG
jgi:glycosyltransferase involved in cell wall biosynthesis